MIMKYWGTDCPWSQIGVTTLKVKVRVLLNKLKLIVFVQNNYNAPCGEVDAFRFWGLLIQVKVIKIWKIFKFLMASLENSIKNGL